MARSAFQVPVSRRRAIQDVVVIETFWIRRIQRYHVNVFSTYLHRPQMVFLRIQIRGRPNDMYIRGEDDEVILD
uniref:Uncharacterized protein n=1 Tax=Steinernema glaseri TaxID=37863 RepID=A0A1I7XZU8_9BILA